MTKRPVENLRRHVFLKEQGKKVDTLMASAIQAKQPRIDVELIDQAFRPYSVRLAAARFDNEDAQQTVDAVTNLVAGMCVELICSMIPLGQPHLATEFGQTLINEIAVNLQEGLQGVYSTKQ